MEVLGIIIGLLMSGSAVAFGFVWWCEKPERDWEKKLKPVADPDPLVELQEVHRLELQDWDFAFQCATGKEAFPAKPTIVRGCYEPLAGLRSVGQLSWVDAQQVARAEHQTALQKQLQNMGRQAQQAQGMVNMLGGLGNPFR